MERRKFIQSSAKLMVGTAFLSSPFTNVLAGKQYNSEWVLFGRKDKKDNSTFLQKIYFPKNKMIKGFTPILSQFYEIKERKNPDNIYKVKYYYERYDHNKNTDLYSFKLNQVTKYNIDLDPHFRYLNRLTKIEFYEGENYIIAYYKEGEQELSHSLVAKGYVNTKDQFFELEEDFEFFKPDTRTLTIPEKFGYDNNIQDDDCFLTSACVFYKGLSDNCSELQVLRNFRDQYMANSAYGKSLINDYYEVGPKTVQAIHDHPQKSAILEFIYNQLVLKSVSLIRRNEYELAMEYYKTFTEKLRTNLAVN